MDDNRALMTNQSSCSKTIRAGICVLVIDGDATCLKIIEAMLRKFQYKVVTIKHASDALAILRERRGAVNIVLTDLHMPEMNGLALLEHVEAEFKIPVVIMSDDADEDVVASRCLKSGSSFYFTKPLTTSEISSLWQYVYLKRHNDTMVIEQIRIDSEPSKHEKDSNEDTECGSSINETNWRQKSWKETPKRKNQNEGGNKYDNATQKSSRVVWTLGLHTKFLDAIDQIGIHRAVPKNILEVMNVEGLKRENVASHLQKYRMFLRRFKEASRSSESSIIRQMNSGSLKSRFALRRLSLMLNAEQEFSRYSEQQRARSSFQPRLGSSSKTQQSHENSLLKGNNRKLKQPSVDTISQNDGNYSSSQMEPLNINLASSRDTLKMIHQQAQARTSQFPHGLLDHTFNTTSLPTTNSQIIGNQTFNFFGIGHGPSSGTNSGYNRMDFIRNGKSPVIDTGKSSLIPGFTTPYTDYAAQGLAFSSGLMPRQVSAPSGWFMPQAVASSSGFVTTDSNYSWMDEIRNGKGPMIDTGKSPLIPGFTSSYSDYAAQGIAFSSGLIPHQVSSPPCRSMPQAVDSSSGFVTTNPFSPILTNVSHQEPPWLPPPPPPQQQNDIEVLGEEVDSICESMKLSSPFGNVSSDQSIDEDYINDILFEPVE
ncbi:two-component response regulator ORR26-like isoform X2 [Macadamia integrifolia]|uniref:two-component response regulator ORR26-like isoform X2 n=1 Tax=Macadamia integrifolia TaxID=60698 RepID=UPI001C4E4C53|nr:two-component response regulator ORR26-like isoform X2 [Macadamia integrifolia]